MAPEWLNVANAWVSIPLALVGFFVVIYQASKARGAAESAKLASEATSAKINSNLLLVVLPQLVQIESNLEWAIEWAASHGNRSAIVHYLGAWRWQASQARGHIDRADDDNQAALAKLQESITIAADTKLALQDPAADVRRRTRSAMKAIAEVTGLLGEMTTKNAMEGQAGNGN